MKRNRLLAVLLAVMVLFGAALTAPGSALAEEALATGTVNTGRLNVRSDAGTGYSLVTTIDKGTAVNIYEVKGAWLRIDIPSAGKSGYVSGKYISVNAPYNPFYGLGYTKGSVYLRAKSNTGSTKLATLSANTGLSLLSVASNGWFYVRVHGSGKEGYVSNRYVSVVCKAAQGAYEQKGTITGEGVNLRSGAGITYKSLGKLARRTAVTVLSVSGNWCQVKVTSTGKTGYVYRTYVQLSSTPAPTPTPSAANAYISRSGVNYRTGASTSYKSLGRLSRGTAVTVLGSSGSWYQIQVVSSGKTGYVYKTYVKFTAATPTPTPSSQVTANAFINASGVNYRAGASTAHTSLGRLAKNTSIAVLGVTGDWYYIQIINTGKTGYVYKSYVTLLVSVATPTPKPVVTATPVPTATPTPTPTPTPPGPYIRTPIPE